MIQGHQLQHEGSSSLTRDRTQAPCIRSWSLSLWTTRGVPERMEAEQVNQFLDTFTLGGERVSQEFFLDGEGMCIQRGSGTAAC